MATKSSFTSGISTPAWLRMNATAKSGSMPELQPGDDRDGAGGRHGGDVAVPEPAHRADPLALGAAGAVWSGPQMLRSHSANTPRSRGQPLRLDLGLLVHELLDLPPERHALVGVVGNAELDEEVGQAHHAEPDAADALRQLGDLRQRVLVGVDDVLEEMGREVDHLTQAVPVDLPVPDEHAEVDRAEVADVVRQEGLLTAGIGRLVGAEVRDRIVVVGLVDEEHARLAGLPGAVDDPAPRPRAR